MSTLYTTIRGDTMRFVYCLFILLSSALGAQTIHVQQLDENFNVRELSEAAGKNVKTKTLNELKAEKHEKEMPSNADVIQSLINAGLVDEAKTFDMFARDQLYRRAGYFSSEQLEKLYPKSSKVNLKKLIELVLRKNQFRENK